MICPLSRRSRCFQWLTAGFTHRFQWCGYRMGAGYISLPLRSPGHAIAFPQWLKTLQSDSGVISSLGWEREDEI